MYETELDWKPLKSGPTFHAKTFDDIIEILKNPLHCLLALEGVFKKVIRQKQ